MVVVVIFKVTKKAPLVVVGGGVNHDCLVGVKENIKLKLAFLNL
jgi:hypothetical protein